MDVGVKYMEFRQLNYILVVSQEGSMSKAAEILHVAQPSLSAQIKKVEAELKQELFVRHAQGVQLTPAGRVVVEYAEKMSHLLFEMHTSLDSLDDAPRGVLRLGSIPTGSAYWLPTLLADFEKTYPQVQVRLREIETRVLVDELAEAKLDAAVVNMPVEDLRMGFIRIGREAMYAVVPAGHPLAIYERIHVADFIKFPYVDLPLGYNIRAQVHRYFAEVGMFPKIPFELSSISTTLGFVQAGLGVTILPRSSIYWQEQAGVLKSIPLEPAMPERQIALAHLKDRPLRRLAALFLEHALAYQIEMK